MNQPLDPKHVANENMFEESNPVNSLGQEEQLPVVENQEEKPESVASAPEIESPEEQEPEVIIPEPIQEIVSEVVSDVVSEVVSDVIETETQENTLDDEAVSVEEDNSDKSDVEVEVVDPEANDFTEQSDKLTKEQIVERLGIIANLSINESVKAEVDALKQSFYKQKRIETEADKKAFVENGGEEAEFIAPNDNLEESFKEKLQSFREKKASLIAESEKIKGENLKAKQAIIEELKALIESQDDFYKVYNEFRRLQQRWKDIKQVPQASVNDLWKAYQHYSEKFYDLLKINNEMRDYDFKKNLELKIALCEAAERLDEEKDVVSAFYQLQNLHQEWREIGPVAKELREEIWSRFKKASTVVNKKHQDHFEGLRALEQRNLEEKTTICEEMETIDYSKLAAFKEWDEQNRRVLELQEKWKTVGFAPKKSNVKIFERFRASCDTFFQRKSDFYKGVKEGMEVNYEKKKALCEKAEELKDSQDWKETTDKLIALQKEWKTVGPIARKHSDAIWKRFIASCDYFFEQKNTHFSSQKSEELENLKLKKNLIKKLKEIDESIETKEAVAIVRGIISEWNAVGHVPFRDKDKIYKEYKDAVDKQFDRLKVDESERRLQSFRSNMNDLVNAGDKSKNKLYGEREKLMRTYDRLKNDIQTYENNIGFLSISSKGGGGLVKDMNHKIESLKEELNLVIKKVELIDENLESQK
ncbi:MAG: DUF349 domain-containing protein [Dysgonamonadaceae bacterium]|jgi:hypothetical protein|nr:DUF349 domain-containing protein [Dysgonamonadaceae bacterium]